MLFTPVIQVRSRSIVAYNQFYPSGRSILQQASAEKLQKEDTYTGRLCPGAKKRLTKAIELIVQACTEVKSFHFTHPDDGKSVKGKYTLTFVTFTIHNPYKRVIGRDAHKQCLEPMLLWMRRKYGMCTYLWKAELQSNRKDVQQLHYHLTSDVAIPHWELRDKWNELQMKAGYLDDYYKQKGHYNANSTDVHSVYKVADMGGYLKKSIIKEFSKGIQNQDTIGGKVWDCSLNLKAEKYFNLIDADVDTSKYRHSDPAFNNLMAHVEANCSDIYLTDNCTVYTFSQPTWRLLEGQVKQDYLDHMKRVLAYERVTVKKQEMDVLPEKLRPKINIKPKLSLFSTS
jgi:hypothetical protein